MVENPSNSPHLEKNSSRALSSASSCNFVPFEFLLATAGTRISWTPTGISKGQVQFRQSRGNAVPHRSRSDPSQIPRQTTTQFFYYVDSFFYLNQSIPSRFRPLRARHLPPDPLFLSDPMPPHESLVQITERLYPHLHSHFQHGHSPLALPTCYTSGSISRLPWVMPSNRLIFRPPAYYAPEESSPTSG